jgi:uncharacterized membrane protein
MPTPAGESGTFRRAILRGLGVVMPPLLTLVLFIWAWNLIESYVLRPLEGGIRYMVVWNIEEVELEPPEGAILRDPNDLRDGFTYEGIVYVADDTGTRFLPQYVTQYVNANLHRLGPFNAAPETANAYWHRYVQLRYLPRSIVVPVFLLVFLVALYFLGRIFTHGLGRWTLNAFDRFINRLPLISNVYGSVKQVTDFVFSDREIEFNRVVAIEYPRKGIWSVGFVTGQSMTDIAATAGEPMLSVLMPTSPMPMTGFTVTVPRSEAIDLNITVDQAIQFVVSCGVVVPAAQQSEAVRRQIEHGAGRTSRGESEAVREAGRGRGVPAPEAPPVGPLDVRETPALPPQQHER